MKVEEKGDLTYYKRKNAELQAQLQAQRESEKTNRRIDDLQQTIEDFRRIIVSGGDLPCVDKATSSMETLQVREDKQSRTKYGLRGKDADVVFRPPLKGISALPVRERGDAVDSESADAILNKQIADLVAKRKELRQAQRGEI